jgi:hypothetical protein
MLTGDSSLSKVRELRKLKVFQTFYFEGEDTIHTWVDKDQVLVMDQKHQNQRSFQKDRTPNELF